MKTKKAVDNSSHAWYGFSVIFNHLAKGGGDYDKHSAFSRDRRQEVKAHFFGQKFKVLKVDKTMLDYYTKLSDFHAQFRYIGTNYNQVVKELRIHFSEKKAMALLYKLEKCTIDLVKLSREIVELSREMEKCYQSKSD